MDKLRQLLKFIRFESEHKKRKPTLLAIVNTDSTAITGDDMVGAAKMFEKETGVPSISVDAPGFKGWDTTGYDLAYRALLTKFAKLGVTKKPDSVNIIAPYLLSSQNWLFDFEEIKNLLNKLGISVNCVLTRNTKIEDIENFGAAQLNLMLTNEDLPLFEKEAEKLGVPNFGADLPLPYGLVNTEEWYYAIGSSYYFNTFRYLPIPDVGYGCILYLLQELGLAMEDMFHEREAWKKLCYKSI